MMRESKILMILLLLIVINYTVGLFQVLNVLPRRWLLVHLLLKVIIVELTIILLSLQILLAHWLSNSFLLFHWSLSRATWKLHRSSWSLHHLVRTDCVTSLFLLWNLVYLFLLIQFETWMLVFYARIAILCLLYPTYFIASYKLLWLILLHAWKIVHVETRFLIKSPNHAPLITALAKIKLNLFFIIENTWVSHLTCHLWVFVDNWINIIFINRTWIHYWTFWKFAFTI